MPTVGGECIFEPGYGGNPLVNAFALGIFRKDKIFFGQASGSGNPVIYVGAKTGKDGIHGASMASSEFDHESEEKRPNVQVGDPFLEKLLLEACLEAMDTGAIEGIQDMGAAGLTCSTCEMGGRGGSGVEIDLKYVPQRESGMTPYEIMLSESQERMLLVAKRGHEKEVYDVFSKWGLDAVEIGVIDFSETAGLGDDLVTLLSSSDICSKRWIFEQYDHMVRTNTTAGPGGDAAVVRVKEIGVSLAMALDGNGRFCALDPREGAKLGVAECCRNLSVVGAEPMAATNCLNFGNPEKPEIMAQLVQAIEGMGDACRHFGTPITGGNVSLYNETLGKGIYPTPVVGVVGLIRNQDPPLGIHFQQAGRQLVLLGGLMPCATGSGAQINRRFGSSQYAKVVIDALWGLPPQLDMDYEKRVHLASRRIVGAGLAESAHDLSDGGLAVAVAESSFGSSEIGASIELSSELPAHYLLYYEAPSRILFSVAKDSLNAVLAITNNCSVEASVIGETVEGHVAFSANGKELLDRPVSELYECWASSLERTLAI